MRFKRASKPKPTRSLKRSAPAPKPGRAPSRLWIGMVVAGAVLVSGAAWAYQEVTRPPEPVPADDALIPPPETEPLSRFFPANTAVYGRLSLNGPTTALIRHGLSGFGVGTVLEGMPWTRYVLPGLNALMGYPLLLDGNGDLALENQEALESDETRRILAEIFAEAEGDAVLGIYATPSGYTPFQASMAVRMKNPLEAQVKLDDLRMRFRGAPLFDGIRLKGDHLWVSTGSQVETAWWSDLQADRSFKRTMAHLPEDRFATMYVNGPELRRISQAYERYLKSGEEVGEALLGLAGGMIADPATRGLLNQFEQEGFMEQHLGTAATFRLGILQGHTHTDWQPEDPESLRKASEAFMRATTARNQPWLDGER